jgi:hypothetical protein
MRLTSGPAMSATQGRKPRHHARAGLLGQRPDSLGSAQAAKEGGSGSRPRGNGPRAVKQRPRAREQTGRGEELGYRAESEEGK